MKKLIFFGDSMIALFHKDEITMLEQQTGHEVIIAPHLAGIQKMELKRLRTYLYSTPTLSCFLLALMTVLHRKGLT